MRLSILLNWRQALLTAGLVLMMFAPNSSECQAGLWIEQKRQPEVSYQIVKVKMPMPTWLLRLQALLLGWQVRRKRFLRLLCQLLSFCLLVWLNLLGWLIQKIMIPPEVLMQGEFVWSRPLSGATLEVKMVISLLPTVSENIVLCEKKHDYDARRQLAANNCACPIIVDHSEAIIHIPQVIESQNGRRSSFGPNGV